MNPRREPTDDELIAFGQRAKCCPGGAYNETGAKACWSTLSDAEREEFFHSEDTFLAYWRGVEANAVRPLGERCHAATPGQ
jgi:hypothetical protein